MEWCHFPHCRNGSKLIYTVQPKGDIGISNRLLKDLIPHQTNRTTNSCQYKRALNYSLNQRTKNAEVDVGTLCAPLLARRASRRGAATPNRCRRRPNSSTLRGLGERRRRGRFAAGPEVLQKANLCHLSQKKKDNHSTFSKDGVFIGHLVSPYCYSLFHLLHWAVILL
jgi:hypothetical protein